MSRDERSRGGSGNLQEGQGIYVAPESLGASSNNTADHVIVAQGHEHMGHYGTVVGRTGTNDTRALVDCDCGESYTIEDDDSTVDLADEDQDETPSAEEKHAGGGPDSSVPGPGPALPNPNA